MICAIVLAAGQSRRMGTHKLLLDYGGRPLIVYVVDQALASRVDHVYVVSGYRGDRIANALAGRKVSFVVNADYEGGMLSSVRCGIAAVPDSCRAVVIVLGDQPAITAGVIDGLIDAFARTQKGIVVPMHDGRRGHPTLISMEYRQAILTRYDDIGLRGLLHEHPEDILEVSVDDLDISADMDTPEDYARHLRRHDCGASRDTSSPPGHDLDRDV